MSTSARYDGLADWYDSEIHRLAITETALSSLNRLLGQGPGRCLDVGCGTGIAIPRLQRSGWSVVGVDISADQLRVAGQQTSLMPVELIKADASALPFEDASFDAVVSVFTHTDFDQPALAFREMARVLRPGGRLVYVGTHPCFVSPFVERLPDFPYRLHPGYRQRGWISSGPGFGQGIRPRVGVNQSTLSDLLQMVLDAGLNLIRVEEPGEEDYPILISFLARR